MERPDSAPRTWSPIQLIKTLTFFDTIPFGSILGTFLFGAQSVSSSPVLPTATNNGASLLIFDFRQPNSNLVQVWGALDDVVMGGVSSSGLQLLPSSALFTGNVSTANSGGFASIRTKNLQPAINLSTYSGIELRVKGDGNRYKFFLRSDDRWDGIGYAHSFNTTPGEWITVKIPFDSLIPVLRAKTISDAAPINTNQIYSFQLMLSKFEYDGQLNPHFQPGEFRLEVETMSAYR
jgi:hypothetical protein